MMNLKKDVNNQGSQHDHYVDYVLNTNNSELEG